MFSGGALSRFTIFALGIMPYISASIIMQLMTAVSPTLEALKKGGRVWSEKNFSVHKNWNSWPSNRASSGYLRCFGVAAWSGD